MIIGTNYPKPGNEGSLINNAWAGQAGERGHRGLGTATGGPPPRALLGQATRPEECWGLHQVTPTFPLAGWVCLGFPRVPAALSKRPQGFSSTFGRNLSVCPSDPQPCQGHEPVACTEARLLVGRPSHPLLCRPILLLSWAVCLQSEEHPRPHSHTPSRGGLEVVLLEQGAHQTGSLRPR